jgi:hypothetical protein
MSSVYGLCNALAGRAGMHLRVLTTDTAGLKLSESVPVTNFPMIYPPGYEVFFCHRQWAASFSTDLLLRLWPMIRWADVVHLTAVYSPPTIPTLLICRLLNKPVVWSPRGALQRWEKTRKPLVKKVWERICNALICRTRCILHVTSDKETRESFSRISNRRGRPRITESRMAACGHIAPPLSRTAPSDKRNRELTEGCDASQ